MGLPNVPAAAAREAMRLLAKARRGAGPLDWRDRARTPAQALMARVLVAAAQANGGPPISDLVAEKVGHDLTERRLCGHPRGVQSTILQAPLLTQQQHPPWLSNRSPEPAALR